MSDLEFTAHLPKKRMGAGAFILDGNGSVLIVKPTYRDDWLLPGGIVEAHESPAAACVREVREELGLDVSLQRLLCLEYRSATPSKTESLQFVFYGGILSVDQIETIVLLASELSHFGFVSIDEAQSRLESTSACRAGWAWQALQDQSTIYAEDGRCHTPLLHKIESSGIDGDKSASPRIA